MNFIRGARKGFRRRGCGSISALKSIATALLIGALWVSSAALAGELDQVRDFNIPAQPLDKALLQFGAQARVQLSISLGPAKAEHMTRTLNGSYTGKEALSALLLGTGLRYSVHGVTVEIRQVEVLHTGTAGPSHNARVSPRSLASADSSDPPATATDPPLAADEKPKGWLHEIIVTAQKFSQPAFDVPISLDVISGETLQQEGITELSNLQYDVPGLHMDGTGVTDSVYLRGVGNFEGSGAMVGQYIDEADITIEGDLSGATGGDTGLYDLNRVEVLKGPQGTLYGDGSLGGVIRYITNRPALDQMQMNADVATMFTQYGAPSQRIEMMLNTPLIDGTLGLRLAGMLEHDGGWVDEPAANLKNINDGNLTDVRAQALWRPTARLNVNVMQIVHRHAYGLGTGEDASGDLIPLFDTILTPHASDNFNLSNVTMTYDFDGVRLLNSGSYITEENDIANQFESETLGPDTIWVLSPNSNVNNKDVSDELRLAHIGRGPWEWTVGGFYKHFTSNEATAAQYEGPAGSTLSSAFTFPLPPQGDSSSLLAGFANTSYEFLGRVTFGAGVRYSKDRETAAETGEPVQAATFTSTDPRFFIQYQVSPDINTYASASKGFRSGGFNTAFEPPYGPESLWSYDLGSKFRVPERRMRADVDLFDMIYSDFVSSSFTPTLEEVQANVGKARITGVDADLTWLPVDGWRLTANTEILHSEFLAATPISGYAAGDRLPYAPTYSFTTSVERDFSLDNRPAYVDIYYYEISRTQFRLAGVPLSQSNILRFLNCRVGVSWHRDLQLAVFAHNLLNDRGYESVLNDFNVSARPQPRTFGIEFETGAL